MSNVLNTLYTLWNQIFYAISSIGVFDFIDILIIAFIIFKAIHFFMESRGGQLIKGLFILLFAYAVSIWFDLVTVRWLLTRVVDWGIIALAIIFQPELRRALERIGRSNFSKIGYSGNTDTENLKLSIDKICQAAQNMHDQKTGALIVFERITSLGDIINTGTVIDSEASAQMVGSIFYPKSPLHDGALIVREGRLIAAGCILPLTNNQGFSSSLGTRHRAAIGISEVSDAVVIVVSEETGKISLVHDGNIERGYDNIRLREELYRLLLENNEREEEGLMVKIKNFINRIKPEKKKEKGESDNEEI
ncbi:MAG: TIGR00159 family protein [Ruminococcaceae bacterium]|nr:TIGR00159 family protein [Oscillospiraceae bacterium]